MVPRLVPCFLLGVGLSGTFVYIALSSPTRQIALSDLSSFRSARVTSRRLKQGIAVLDAPASSNAFACRDTFLTGRYTDRDRKFSLQPYEIAPLLLSFVVNNLSKVACLVR